LYTLKNSSYIKDIEKTIDIFLIDPSVTEKQLCSFLQNPNFKTDQDFLGISNIVDHFLLTPYAKNNGVNRDFLYTPKEKITPLHYLLARESLSDVKLILESYESALDKGSEFIRDNFKIGTTKEQILAKSQSLREKNTQLTSFLKQNFPDNNPFKVIKPSNQQLQM